MDNRHSAAIGVALGIGALVLSFVLPHFFHQLPELSWDVMGGCSAALVLVSVLALIFPAAFQKKVFAERHEVKPIHRTAQVEVYPKIGIKVQQGGVYDRAELSVIGTIHRTAQIGVKNEGNSLLSNCKVFCETREQNSQAQRWLLSDIGGLSVGEERRLGIASYTEPNAEGHTGAATIQLHAPVGSGYGGFLPTLPADGGALWISALSDETPPCEAIVRLWVDARLRWQRV